MNATNPLSAAASDTDALGPTQPSQLAIVFSGSGREYWRIWIVNMLLTVLTLGLYYPWAKARHLRYFYSHTQIGGQALGFHGNPKKMFRGFVLIAALFGIYSLADGFSPTAGFVALLVVTAIWPALFKSAMQFRLANTSWRGLRFQFHGTLKGAYQANTPLFILAILLLGIALFGHMASGAEPVLASTASTLALSVVLAPWLFWNLKQYQHNHYGLGALQTEFKVTVRSVYLLFLKFLGFFAAGIALVSVPIMFSKPLLFVAGVYSALVSLLPMLVVLRPYATSRTQNLVWNQTQSTSLRFVSTLRFRSLLWLTVKNWFWTLITLGLYWPFAKIAVARMRLQAVCIETSINLQTLMPHTPPRRR